MTTSVESSLGCGLQLLIVTNVYTSKKKVLRVQLV